MAISSGESGSRLTHSHERHYNFVLQSLSLWRDIVDDMFRLWCLAEDDLLDKTRPYELRDTGQGLQRLQQSPRIQSAMRLILHHAQQELGSWVGSSVIHLGDTNVPNALTFIGKVCCAPPPLPDLFLHGLSLFATDLLPRGYECDSFPFNSVVHARVADKYTQVSRILAPIVQVCASPPPWTASVLV